ncbi:MAG: hypothetical protein ASARMPREDX12_007894 [Alectoria sarmentosa]|nr:MAG: hypothetical protein ASARMPREDX12_007894 [Alectoria sarmentosa]
MEMGTRRQAEHSQFQLRHANINNFSPVSAILSSVFFFSLDQTIVADIIPDIVEHFGAVQKLPWISVTLLLAAAGTINFWAKVYGQFDPKWLYIYCVLGFEIGSAVCGAAPSMNALIIGRAIAGLGGAGMYLGVIMLLSIFTTETERPNYFAMLGGIFGIGTVLGPIVGGAFADSSATWRWAFYINLCIGGLFAPIYFLYLPSRDPRPGASFLSRCREIDYLGTLLQIGAFVSGIMAISFGGVLYAWNSATIIALFILSGVLFIVLALQQTFTILTTLPRRVFPIHYVTQKEMAILFVQIALGSTNSFIAIYFIPLYFQFVQSDQALRSGVRLLPYIIPLVFATLLNGALMEKLKYYLPWFLTGGLLIIVSNVMLFHISLTTSTAYIYAALVFGGLGTGLFINAPFAIAQWLVPPEEIALAVGFITCAQVAGVTISLAMANAVFLNLAENAITDLLPGVAKADVQAAITGAGGAFLRTLDPGMQRRVLEATVVAIQRVFVLGITAGVMVVVLALGMSRAAIELGGPEGVAGAIEEADREEKGRETERRVTIGGGT